MCPSNFASVISGGRYGAEGARGAQGRRAARKARARNGAAQRAGAARATPPHARAPSFATRSP